MSGQPSEVDSAVRSRFTVKDSFQLPDGEVEYTIDYGPGSKAAFLSLVQEVSPKGLTPWLTGSKEECTLTVRRTVAQPSTRSRVPLILAFLTLGSIVVFSLFERVFIEQFAPELSGSFVLLSYGIGVAAMLGVQEAGKRYMAMRSRSPSPVGYTLPGIPVITSFLPFLGFITSQRGAVVNRDRLFEIMLVGPLLTLGLAVAVYVVGDLTLVQSSVPLSGNLSNSTIFINANLIQAGVDTALGPLLPKISPGFLPVSPLVDAATIGFVIAFVSLLPVASYPGGYLANLVWGPKKTRAASYLCVVLLILFDTPNYWALAIVALLLVGRPLQLQFLDEVSEVSPTKRWLLFAAIALALLSVPVPGKLASFPLT